MILIKLHPNVPFSETVCSSNDSDTKTQGQCYIFKVMWFLPFNLVSNPYLLSSLNEFFLSSFTQMLPSVKRCAEFMTQFRTVNVKVTLKGNGIVLSIPCTLHISRTLWTSFLKFTQMFLSVRRWAEPMTQGQGPGYTSRSWYSTAVLQTAVS